MTVTSTEDATWQGMVETDGKCIHFTNELQLLQWMMEQYPVLQPEVRWEREEDYSYLSDKISDLTPSQYRHLEDIINSYVDAVQGKEA